MALPISSAWGPRFGPKSPAVTGLGRALRFGILAALPAVAIVGCAGRSGPPAYPTLEEEERAASARSAAPATDPETPALAVGSPSIRRRALAAFLDKGPAALFAVVPLRAAFDEGHFAGWEIVSFQPDDPALAGLDLAPGDLVLRVNGRGFERPEEFFDIWESLRFATTITVSYRRGGVPHELVVPIVP